jgi:hypothetical protein
MQTSSTRLNQVINIFLEASRIASIWTCCLAAVMNEGMHVSTSGVICCLYLNIMSFAAKFKALIGKANLSWSSNVISIL